VPLCSKSVDIVVLSFIDGKQSKRIFEGSESDFEERENVTYVYLQWFFENSRSCESIYKCETVCARSNKNGICDYWKGSLILYCPEL
uniref:Apple domain-containing protein n=1 Tax=Loa loa TaxID=7209 RepID=A0A1I7VH45_LOALO